MLNMRRIDSLEYKIDKIERGIELPYIENVIMSEIRNGIARKSANWYDDVAFSMLKSYGITKDNWLSQNDRIKVIKQSMYYDHFFVDGYYAFTLRQDTSLMTEWEKESTYMARVEVKVEIMESMKGMRLE